MKLGYNTWSMPTLSFEGAIRYCASLGFDSVELTVSEGWQTDVMRIAPGTTAEWKSILSDVGMSITSLTANTPVIADGEIWALSRERLIKSLELAADLQATNQRMPISLTASRPSNQTADLPPVTSQARWDNERAIIVDRFGELAAIAVKLGARVALEPHVGTVVCKAERALAVMSSVASESLGLNLDISHFAVQGVPTKEVVQALGPYAIASEVKDQTGVVPDFLFQIPGEGTFDYAEFLREMATVGYEGSVSVEISVLRQRLPGYDPYEAARQSYWVLSEAFEKAGVARPNKS